MNDWDRQALVKLNSILANLYPTQLDSRRIASNAGLNTLAIEFDNKALNNWFNILQYAAARAGKVDQLVQAALEENPDDDSLQRAAEREPPSPLKEPEASPWSGPTSRATLEKIMGAKSTLVPITYLEVGLMCARSIVRVRRDDGSSGTGFLVPDNMLLTNNHVIPDAAVARSSLIQFNYQQTVAGLSASFEETRLLPDVFFRTSIDDDWSMVRIEGDYQTKWGALPLKSIQVSVGDHVNIIQHPGGGPKQISLFANVVAYVGSGRVQYLTDTLPGSSGAPVFDSNWNVVALHHSGGWLTEPNAASKSTYYRNEGISIDRIIERTRQAG
jgi:hypothetical protein